MKDYDKTIKTLERALLLLGGDKLDRQHAVICIQFAMLDLKELDRNQDKEIASMVADYDK